MTSIIRIIKEDLNTAKKNIDINNNNNYNYSNQTIEVESIDDSLDDDYYTEQYGGNQLSFEVNLEELLKDDRIMNNIREYFPNSSLEECEFYLKKIADQGCGYVALVNTLFREFKSDDFEEKFGFPKSIVDENGSKNYNYEYLVLEYFNYVWGNSGYKIGEIIDDEFDVGSNDDTRLQFPAFLKKKYNIDCDIKQYNQFMEYKFDDDIISPQDFNKLEIYNQLKNKNNHIIIGANGFDLYNNEGEMIYEDFGGHDMYVTDIKNNDLVVSSWGEEYILDLNSINIDSLDSEEWYEYITVEYN